MAFNVPDIIKTTYPEQNRHRTHSQIKLQELMETNQTKMESIINSYP